MNRLAAASTSIRFGFCCSSLTLSVEFIIELLAVCDEVDGLQISGSELKCSGEMMDIL
jgi:hypothetical protein